MTASAPQAEIKQALMGFLSTRQFGVVKACIGALYEPLTQNWLDRGQFLRAAEPLLMKHGRPFMQAKGVSRVIAEHVWNRMHQLFLDPRLRAASDLGGAHGLRRQMMPSVQQPAFLHQTVELAMRMKAHSLFFLGSVPGRNLFIQCIAHDTVSEPEMTRRLAASAEHRLEKLEDVLLEVLWKAMEGLDHWQRYSMVVAILERVREHARRFLDDRSAQLEAESFSAAIVVLVTPLRKAERAQAAQAFRGWGEAERQVVVQRLRKKLLALLPRLTLTAMLGDRENLLTVVENALYPYPEAIGCVQAVLTPLYEEALKITSFTDCEILGDVHTRLKTLTVSDPLQQLIVKLAAAIALKRIQDAESARLEHFGVKLDPVARFGWPKDFAEFERRSQQQRPRV